MDRRACLPHLWKSVLVNLSSATYVAMFSRVSRTESIGSEYYLHLRDGLEKFDLALGFMSLPI